MMASLKMKEGEKKITHKSIADKHKWTKLRWNSPEKLHFILLQCLNDQVLSAAIMTEFHTGILYGSISVSHSCSVSFIYNRNGNMI